MTEEQVIEEFYKLFCANVNGKLHPKIWSVRAKPEPVKSFILEKLAEAREEGRREADWHGGKLVNAVASGKTRENKRIRQAVEGMKKDMSYKSALGSYELTVRGTYNQALEDVLRLLDKPPGGSD